MTAVFIVAAVPALRAGLAAMLEQAGLSVAGASADIPTDMTADVLLIAGMSLDDVDELPGPTVLLSDDARQATFLQGLSGWAMLPPGASSEQLAAAVTAAAQGLAAMPSEAMLTRPPVEVSDPLQEPLTPRELEVLQLVSQGLSNKLIARQLSISEHTVKFHVSSTYAKLGAASRTEAVSLAARRGLVSL